MSNNIKSIDDLRKTAAEEELNSAETVNDDVGVKEEEEPATATRPHLPGKRSAEDYMKVALQRQEEEEENNKKKAEEDKD